MKQTVVQQLEIAFRQWQKDWDNYDIKRKNKPISFDKFIEPFLELEKQQQGYSEEGMKLPFEAGRKRGNSGYPNTDNFRQPNFAEFLQRLRGTLSDVEARRLIFETFKNK